VNNYSEHIEDYVFDRMSQEDRASFEAEMAKDASLRQKVQEFQKSIEVMHGVLEEDTRRILMSEESSGKVIQHGAKRSVGRLMAIAAGLLILVVSVWLLNQQMNGGIENKSFAELYAGAEPPWPGETRGDVELLGQAIYEARNGVLEKGMAMIQNLDTTDIVKNYWLAEVFLEKQMPDSVLKYLPRPTVEMEEVRLQKIMYVEILAYKLKGDYEKIRQLREQLPDDFHEFYQRRVD